MPYRFSTASLVKLHNVHPDLVKIAVLAITLSPVDFGVIYGIRTVAEEAAMVAKHASETMHSRHLPNKQGYACAIDIDAFKDGIVDWKDIDLFVTIHGAMMKAAAQLGIPLEWGGDWTTLKDWGHYQLPWGNYP